MYSTYEAQGSECEAAPTDKKKIMVLGGGPNRICLLYTSDAADERSSVDLGGRRFIQKKKHDTISKHGTSNKSQTVIRSNNET